MKSDQNHHNFAPARSAGHETGVIETGEAGRATISVRISRLAAELRFERAYSEVIETSAGSCGTVGLP